MNRYNYIKTPDRFDPLSFLPLGSVWLDENKYVMEILEYEGFHDRNNLLENGCFNFRVLRFSQTNGNMVHEGRYDWWAADKKYISAWLNEDMMRVL